MEYVHGRNLASLRDVAEDRVESFPVPIAAKIASRVFDGLHCAREYHDTDGTPLNTVHRDISPQNIMVAYSGAVKIVDFGIAKATVNFGQTHATKLWGKAEYMSPEQVRQNTVLDRRSDVFSLGVVLHELLCGHTPFADRTDRNLILAIANEDAPDVRQVAPIVPAPLALIVARALSRDRARRYPTAPTVGQVDLHRALLVLDAVRSTPWAGGRHRNI